MSGSSFYASPPEDGALKLFVRSNATLKTGRYAIWQMHWAVDLWNQCSDENVRKAARLQAQEDLQLQIESALRDMTTPSCARACLNQKLELLVYSTNLLAFMWLTLARLLSGEIVEQPCMGKSAGYT